MNLLGNRRSEIAAAAQAASGEADRLHRALARAAEHGRLSAFQYDHEPRVGHWHAKIHLFTSNPKVRASVETPSATRCPTLAEAIEAALKELEA